MANRVTATDVKVIIDLDPTMTDPIITAFINSAHRLVDKIVTDDDSTEADKTDIELWLSAHLLAIKDTRAASESAGPVSVSYQHSLGLGLQVTMYGQQVLLLDTSGAFAALQYASENGGVIEGSMNWLGQTEDRITGT